MKIHKKKRICFIAQFPPPIHGLSKAVETLYNSDLKHEFNFTSINITNNKKILINITKLLFSHNDTYYFTISQTKGGLWRDIILMYLIILKQKPFIIHLHGGYLRHLLDYDCGCIQKWLAYKTIKKAYKCIVLGESLRYIFKDIIDNSKIIIVPNCVDNQYVITSHEEQRKLTSIINAPKLRILYLSNFIPTKGYKEVLEVAKVIRNKALEKKFEFHFAGHFYDEIEKSYFNSYIKRNKLENIVFYHGIVTGESKSDLLESCHIFILLTRYPNEGQPISILEAMGNAMSIVTTDHAGIPDIVSHDQGLVCSKNNISINDIVSYLEHCYTNRELLINTCKNNYNLVSKKYRELNYLINMRNIFNLNNNE